MNRPSRRARRKQLHRKISGFPAVLRSSRPGIHYKATIYATLTPEPTGPYDPDEVADCARAALRAAAAASVRDQDPADLPTAQDACAQQLRRPRNLNIQGHSLQVTASVHLELADQDRAAVDRLMAAIRDQATEDAITRQRAEGVAAELSHPAALLARWLQHPDAQVTQPPDEAKLEALAQRLRGYPKDREDPVELRLLDILRDFLAEFPKEEQKRLLMLLLANGMRVARKPDHAEQIEALTVPRLETGAAESEGAV
ncbi:hypothetical protein ACGFR8_13575 [Streptomyces brevispora]|uniref:hypothetical protein n=1 Tax=Streptomyces brevispora TaxID=887462 RepID=UPI00371763C3